MAESQHTEPSSHQQRNIKSGIYVIRCLVNGKVYVGSAVNLGWRWNGHRSDLRKGKHHSPRLQNAWNKHGADAFVFEIIEPVAEEHRLIEREQHHIDRLDAADPRRGFNILPTAGSRLGCKRPPISDETRAKLSAAWRPASAETRIKLSAGRRGKTHTEETKAAIAAKKRGKTLSAEHRAKIAAAGLGRTPTTETRAKLSAANKGQVPWTKGKKHTAESIAKMSAAKKGKVTWNKGGKQSAEWIANRVAARLRNKLMKQQLELERAASLGESEPRTGEAERSSKGVKVVQGRLWGDA